MSAAQQPCGRTNLLMATGRVLTIVFAILSAAACHHAQPPDDKSIVDEIQVRLSRNDTLKRRDISIVAHQGVVELIGQVSSEDEKASAEHVTAGVAGVKRVVNQLVVVTPAIRPEAPSRQETPSPPDYPVKPAAESTRR